VKQRFEEAQKETDRMSYWNGTPVVDIRNFP
jgi:tRNA (Thr-GGU) A37 N-methylase